MFELDIRAIIPQIAMSAGTMIACATKEIIMGKQSNIGPFDPQFNGISAHGVIEEFERALRETKEDPATIPIWQVVVSKYHPAFIGDCEKAIDWSKEIVQKWLITGMFKDDPEGKQKAKRIAEQLSDHRNTKSHSRHIHILEARRLGLVIKSLEADFDQGFQDLVLTVHHAYMHTLANTTAAKIIENHLGNAIVMHHNP